MLAQRMFLGWADTVALPAVTQAVVATAVSPAFASRWLVETGGTLGETYGVAVGPHQLGGDQLAPAVLGVKEEPEVPTFAAPRVIDLEALKVEVDCVPDNRAGPSSEHATTPLSAVVVSATRVPRDALPPCSNADSEVRVSGGEPWSLTCRCWA